MVSARILVTTKLDGKPFKVDGIEHKFSMTPAASFGSVGALSVVNAEDGPITCVKSGEFYYNETYRFSNNVVEYMAYWMNEHNHSVYVGTIYAPKPIEGETAVIPPTRRPAAKDRRILDIKEEALGLLRNRLLKLFPH